LYIRGLVIEFSLPARPHDPRFLALREMMQTWIRAGNESALAASRCSSAPAPRNRRRVKAKFLKKLARTHHNGTNISQRSGSEWSKEFRRVIKLERDRLGGSQGQGDDERSDAGLKRMMGDLANEGKQEQDGGERRRGRRQGTLNMDFSIDNIRLSRGCAGQSNSQRARRTLRSTHVFLTESNTPLKKQHIVGY